MVKYHILNTLSLYFVYGNNVTSPVLRHMLGYIDD